MKYWISTDISTKRVASQNLRLLFFRKQHKYSQLKLIGTELPMIITFDKTNLTNTSKAKILKRITNYTESFTTSTKIAANLLNSGTTDNQLLPGLCGVKDRTLIEHRCDTHCLDHIKKN